MIAYTGAPECDVRDVLIAELTKQRDDLLNACEGVIAWDKKTGLRVPYKVRDPIHEAISSVKGGAA